MGRSKFNLSGPIAEIIKNATLVGLPAVPKNLENENSHASISHIHTLLFEFLGAIEICSNFQLDGFEFNLLEPFRIEQSINKLQII